jgi:hypothetical protein
MFAPNQPTDARHRAVYLVRDYQLYAKSYAVWEES